MKGDTKGRPLRTDTEGRRLSGTDSVVLLKMNAGQCEQINALVDDGFHGNTPAACVMRLLDAKLIELAKESR